MASIIHHLHSDNLSLESASPYFIPIVSTIFHCRQVERLGAMVEFIRRRMYLWDVERGVLAEKRDFNLERIVVSSMLNAGEKRDHELLQQRQLLKIEESKLVEAIERGKGPTATQLDALQEQIHQLETIIQYNRGVSHLGLLESVRLQKLEQHLPAELEEEERFARALEADFVVARKLLSDEQERLARSVVDLVLQWKRNKSED